METLDCIGRRFTMNDSVICLHGMPYALHLHLRISMSALICSQDYSTNCSKWGPSQDTRLSQVE